MGFKNLVVSWVLRISGWSVAGTAYYWFAKFWDYILYSTMVIKYGPLKGGAIMLSASFLLDYSSIRLYTLMGKDIFGLEAVKSLKYFKADTGNRRFTLKWWRSGVGRIISFVLRRSDPVVFLAISGFSNPFFCAAYFKRLEEKEMTRRDWSIFVASFLFSNFVWIGIIHFGYKLFLSFAH